MTNWNVETRFGSGDFVWFVKDKEPRCACIYGLEYRYGEQPYMAYILSLEEGKVAVLVECCFDDLNELEKAYEGLKGNN